MIFLSEFSRIITCNAFVAEHGALKVLKVPHVTSFYGRMAVYREWIIDFWYMRKCDRNRIHMYSNVMYIPDTLGGGVVVALLRLLIQLSCQQQMYRLCPGKRFEGSGRAGRVVSVKTEHSVTHTVSRRHTANAGSLTGPARPSSGKSSQF